MVQIFVIMSRSYYKDIGLQVCRSDYKSDYLIIAYEKF